MAPAPPPVRPPSACPTCLGNTCDEWAELSAHSHPRPKTHDHLLTPQELCDQLQTQYGCDCTGCQCEIPVPPLPLPPIPPSQPPGSPPPPLAPPMAPESTAIQIVGLVVLILVILACVGACGLVIACLMGWLDRGAYALLIAPLRPALRRSPLNSFTPLWQVTCGYDPPANSAACCRGLAGPGKRSRSTMTPKSCASRLDLHD